LVTVRQIWGYESSHNITYILRNSRVMRISVT
jgi:hypothetical protein